MVTVFCDAARRRLIDGELDKAALMCEDWTEFLQAVRGSACVVLVLNEPPKFDIQGLTDHISRSPQTAVVVVSTADVSMLDVLGQIRYDRFVHMDHIERDLRATVEEILRRSPRRMAAHALFSLGKLSPLSKQVVAEVLLHETPVRDEGELAQRLGVPAHRIRRYWRADIYVQARVPLKSFLQWGRRLRAAELLMGGMNVIDVAVLLNIDTSTVYRDLRLIRPPRNSCGLPELLYLFFGTFDMIGGPIEWGVTRPARSVFNFATTMFSLAKALVLLWASSHSIRRV